MEAAVGKAAVGIGMAVGKIVVNKAFQLQEDVAAVQQDLEIAGKPLVRIFESYIAKMDDAQRACNSCMQCEHCEQHCNVRSMLDSGRANAQMVFDDVEREVSNREDLVRDLETSFQDHLVRLTPSCSEWCQLFPPLGIAQRQRINDSAIELAGKAVMQQRKDKVATAVGKIQQLHKTYAYHTIVLRHFRQPYHQEHRRDDEDDDEEQQPEQQKQIVRDDTSNSTSAILLGNDSSPAAFLDADGNNALHRASRDGDLDRVVALLAAGSHMNVAGWNGLTPLHFAAAYGHPNVAMFLLEAGANPYALDKLGYDVCMMAESHLHWELAELIRAQKVPKAFNVAQGDQRCPRTSTSAKEINFGHSAGTIHTAQGDISVNPWPPTNSEGHGPLAASSSEGSGGVPMIEPSPPLKSELSHKEKQKQRSKARKRSKAMHNTWSKFWSCRFPMQKAQGEDPEAPHIAPCNATHLVAGVSDQDDPHPDWVTPDSFC